MIRRQASLYLREVPHIEALRLRHNPLQARLIPAHVTLCREDEVSDWGVLRGRLESLCPLELVLEFGPPLRDDNFVYLPVLSGLEQFHGLRRDLLDQEPRTQTPHLTLIHPRNGTCTDEVFAEIAASISPFPATFREVKIIEQRDAGVWRVVARVGAAP